MKVGVVIFIEKAQAPHRSVRAKRLRPHWVMYSNVNRDYNK
jgi:hypothetical protein